MGATLLPGAIASINVVVLRIQGRVLTMTGDLGDSLFLGSVVGKIVQDLLHHFLVGIPYYVMVGRNLFSLDTFFAFALLNGR